MGKTEGDLLVHTLTGEGCKLIPTEKERLEELENLIHTNFLAFYQVGCALREIRDSKLYRETHDTFELYCRELWDMAKRKVYRLIASSDVIDVLSVDNKQAEKVTNWTHLENQENKTVPLNESQTRPLTRLETPEQQIEAWSKAVETAPDGRITAKHVNDVVSSLVTKKAKVRVGKVKKGLFAEETVSFEFKQAISIFLEAIQVERKSNWKKTLRKDALRYVNEFARMIEREV